MYSELDKKVEIKKETIATIIDMLSHYSKYIESSEDLGINQKYKELGEIRKYINYYDIDDMIDFLRGKMNENDR